MLHCYRDITAVNERLAEGKSKDIIAKKNGAKG